MEPRIGLRARHGACLRFSLPLSLPSPYPRPLKKDKKQKTRNRRGTDHIFQGCQKKTKNKKQKKLHGIVFLYCEEVLLTVQHLFKLFSSTEPFFGHYHVHIKYLFWRPSETLPPPSVYCGNLLHEDPADFLRSLQAPQQQWNSASREAVHPHVQGYCPEGQSRTLQVINEFWTMLYLVFSPFVCVISLKPHSYLSMEVLSQHIHFTEVKWLSQGNMACGW